MSSIAWYWHRLRVMSPGELAAHGRRKVHQLSDALLAGRRFAGVAVLPGANSFPHLPSREAAPEAMRAALRRDMADILSGRWIAFGHLELQVDDPPRWHKDYLVGADLTTRRRALKLHHRLEGKADIKLIWEPSRWYSLVRLAQAAYVLQSERAASTCRRWLANWVQENPPYRGWNWTSALESGLRLIQFVWMDALLAGAGLTSEPAGLLDEFGPQEPPSKNTRSAWARLRAEILPPHLWFTWRDRSFGSSANNHLLGELAGLIVTIVRWPTLARWAAPLETLQPLWEREILTQFAPDGGNREQALNYHCFGWEFCWQARLALQAAGRNVSPEVDDRLRAALSYFTALQVPGQQWDYGDSDSAYVTPLFADWRNATSEWYLWLEQHAQSPAIEYWLGDPPKPLPSPAIVAGAKNWRVYPESGFAVCQADQWFLRWDLSRLGYLATAGHGHCDALHLSIWYQGQPVLIDPGTGAYHADRALRDYLASWDAHNGPRPVAATFPERRGAFLWSAHHQKPRWERRSDLTMSAELDLPAGIVRRTITRLEAANGWQIDDGFSSADPNLPQDTAVLWQLAPSARLQAVNPRAFRIRLDKVTLSVQLDSAWEKIESWAPEPNQPQPPTLSKMRGVCSPAFRRTQVAPFIFLLGKANGPRVLRTTFLTERCTEDCDLLARPVGSAWKQDST